VDDNLAQELLYEQFITDIAVMGQIINELQIPVLFCLLKWAGN
jgi:hypothetical protein